MNDYLTIRGIKFGNSYRGRAPVDLFDAGRYAECAHACLFLFGRIGDGGRVMRAIEDDGCLHELLHLACGIPICTHNNLSELRADLSQLWTDYRENSGG